MSETGRKHAETRKPHRDTGTAPKDRPGCGKRLVEPEPEAEEAEPEPPAPAPGLKRFDDARPTHRAILRQAASLTGSRLARVDICLADDAALDQVRPRSDHTAIGHPPAPLRS
jgi:hypothetical protein